MTIPNIRTDTPPDSPDGPEHDACALIMSVRKGGESTYGTLKRAIHALSHMGHRTGFVEGEGDGAGIQTDIPRQLWGKKLSEAGLRSSIATDPRFWVGHCFIPANEDWREISEILNAHFNDAGLNLLIAEPGPVVMNALGRQARQNAPLFIQLAGYGETADVDNVLFRVQSEVEKLLPIHFASLSSHVVVYKVRGSVEVLPRFYPDLQDRTYYTAMALCHARYSTNTASSFERVQPFPLMGHNGEINTISRFRQEAVQIGAELDPNNSDSQDIDRTLQTLCAKYGVSVIEGLEILFPPVPFEVENMPKPLQAVYNRLRQSFGPYAQGPAAIIARYANMA
ncbi:MAG: glutamate synthase, partial [Anaerolineae bacterium]